MTKLIEKGVQIDQIRRVRNKYEKQQSGTVAGARNISGKSNESESRLRTNNGDNQREDIKEKVDVSSMSEAQFKRYKSEQNAQYEEVLEDLLPDSLSERELSENEVEKKKRTQKRSSAETFSTTASSRSNPI